LQQKYKIPNETSGNKFRLDMASMCGFIQNVKSH